MKKSVASEYGLVGYPKLFNRFKMKVLSNFEYGLVGYPKLESDHYPPPMVMTMGWLATQTLEHDFCMVIIP